MTKTGRGSDKFMLRLPDGMRARVKAATADRRSMNDVIVDALEQYFLRQEQLEAGWRWVEPKHQIDRGLLGELEAIAQAEEGNIPVAVSINSAISRYVAEFAGDRPLLWRGEGSEDQDWQEAEINGEHLATQEDLAALRDDVSQRMERIEKLLAELAGKE